MLSTLSGEMIAMGYSERGIAHTIGSKADLNIPRRESISAKISSGRAREIARRSSSQSVACQSGKA